MSFDPLKLLFEDLEIHQDSNSQSVSSFGSVKVHSLTLSYTPKFLSWPAPLQAFALVMSPKWGLPQLVLRDWGWCIHTSIHI
jgi:hypothetical protein